MVEVVGSIPIAPTKLQPHWMAPGTGRQIGVEMPIITLPDGSKREFDGPVCAMDVAESIGQDLRKQPFVLASTVS